VATAGLKEKDLRFVILWQGLEVGGSGFERLDDFDFDFDNPAVEVGVELRDKSLLSGGGGVRMARAI
jgi:hypothetical protein